MYSTDTDGPCHNALHLSSSLCDSLILCISKCLLGSLKCDIASYYTPSSCLHPHSPAPARAPVKPVALFYQLDAPANWLKMQKNIIYNMQICSILGTVCRFSCLASCLLCQRSGFWWFFFLFITRLVILAKLLWNQSVQNIPNCQFRRPWEGYSHKSVIDVKWHSVSHSAIWFYWKNLRYLRVFEQSH